MAFLRKKRQEVEQTAAHMPLSLRDAAGATWVTFDAAVVRSYRELLAELKRQQPLPERMTLLATLRREGVTYSAVALATVLATDITGSVCVVELNWWWPGLQTLLGESDSAGFAAVLSEECSLDEAILPTGLSNLSLLPAGHLEPEQRTFTANSQQLALYLDELATRFDHLILDIPAILATSDAIALASHGGDCCLVVRQGITPIKDTKLALDKVDHLSIRGVILNQVEVKTPDLLLKYIPQE